MRGAGVHGAGLFGQVKANILLQCVPQIWSKLNTFQISPLRFANPRSTQSKHTKRSGRARSGFSALILNLLRLGPL